jgi:hypothetical protein
MSEKCILSIAKSMSIYHPLDGKISLCVQPIFNSQYGVYANAILIAIHVDQDSADAHCQRLYKEQVQDKPA